MDSNSLEHNGTDSLPHKSEVSDVKKGVEHENEHHVEMNGTEKEDEYNSIISDSMVQITKSQILASQQEETDDSCHTKSEFITSTNEHMIESTYEQENKDDADENEEQEQEFVKEEESKSEHIIKDEEKEEVVEESKENDTEENQDEKEDKDMSNSCVDLGNSEDMKNEILELQQSLITSVELRDMDSEHKTAPVESELTDSCVDLGTEKKNEEKEDLTETVKVVEEKEETAKELVEEKEDETVEEAVQEATENATEEAIEEAAVEECEDANNKEIVDDGAINNSIEIIDKKQCEEDFENVEVKATAEKPKRNIEDEVWEKPLGGDSLLKKVIQYGEELMGRDWRPSSGQMCTISYEACLKDSAVVVEKNDDFSFILGDGDVVSAIDLVVSLMAKNEKCEMVSEARHAYGTLGKKPDIPSNATLCYKLHLKDFKDITAFDLMSPVERLSLAEAKKLRGNFHFNRQDFGLAALSYKRGLKYFELENLKSDEEKSDLEKFADLRKALLMNLALSHFKQSELKKALESLNEVLDLDSAHMKALYIRGKVLMSLGETQEAIISLSKAHELAKDNVEVKNELAKAQQKHKIQYEKEKKMYQKMMRSPDEKKEKAKAAKKGTSPVVTYTIAGLLMAGATLGVAMLAKYKNLL